MEFVTHLFFLECHCFVSMFKENFGSNEESRLLRLSVLPS